MFDSEIPIFVHVSRLNRVFIAAHSSNHHPQNWHLYIDKIDLFFFQISIYLSIYIYIHSPKPSFTWPGAKAILQPGSSGPPGLGDGRLSGRHLWLAARKTMGETTDKRGKKHGEKVTNMVKSGRLFIVILDGISLSYLFVHYFCWKHG